MAVNHVKLKAVLDTGEPFGSDAAALTYMDATVTVHELVDFQELVSWATDRNVFEKLWAGIEDQSWNRRKDPQVLDTPWPVAEFNDMLALWSVLHSGADLDLSKGELRALLNTISGSAKVLTFTDKTELFNRAESIKSRWDAGRHDDGPSLVGFGAMDDVSKLHHIGIARGLP